MNKKYFYIIPILFIIGIILVYFFIIPKNINCDNLEKEIRQLFKNANYCNIDSDCEINTVFAGYNCYSLVNKDADLGSIGNKIADYKENCPRNMLNCAFPPKQEEVECANNKCIDIRSKHW